MNKTVNNKFIISLIILILFVRAVILYAKEEGIVGRTQKNRKGCTCHGETPSSNLIITISGPDTIQSGEAGKFWVSVSESSMEAAGINISASEGELTPTSKDLKKIKGELTHSSPKKLSSGKTIFEFLYNSLQSNSEQIIYASVNAVDLNGKKTGDIWNHAPAKKVFIINSKK